MTNLLLFALCCTALESVDSPYGPDTITREPLTGFDWLDPIVTADRTYVELLEEFKLGGDFAGWRFAELDQVRHLYETSAGIPPGYREGVDTQSLRQLLSLLGFSDTASYLRLAAGGKTARWIEIQWIDIGKSQQPGGQWLENSYVVAWEAVDGNQWSSESKGLHDGNYLIRESLPGDINLDRRVDFADFLILSDRFGMWGGPRQGDLTQDDQVDFADFLILSSNYGKSIQVGTAAVVPEPSALLLSGAVCLMISRRRLTAVNPRHSKTKKEEQLCQRA